MSPLPPHPSSPPLVKTNTSLRNECIHGCLVRSATRLLRFNWWSKYSPRTWFTCMTEGLKKRWTLYSADASITALFLTRSDDYSPSMMHRMVTPQNLVFQEVLSPTASTLIKVWFIFVLVLLKAATQTVWTDFRVVDDYYFVVFFFACVPGGTLGARCSSTSIPWVKKKSVRGCEMEQ